MVLSAHIVFERLCPPSWIHGQESPPPGFGVLMFFFGNGVLGVRIFFVLSGFLITYLMLEEIQRTGRFSLKAFFIRRSLRIWPLYYLTIAFIYGLYPLILNGLGIARQIFENFWMQVFFLSNFDQIRVLTTPGQAKNTLIALLWSISIEEQFYVLWALVLWGLGRRALLPLSGLALGVSLLAQWHYREMPHHLAGHTLTNMIFLAGGGLTAMLFHSRPTLCYQLFARLGYPLCVLISLFWIGLSLMCGLQLHLWPELAPVYASSILLGCSWTFLTQIWRAEQPWGLARIRPLVALAKYTYALYLFHRIAEWLITVLFYLLQWPRADLASQLISVALTLGLSLAMSVLSYHTLESYFLRLQGKARRI